MFRALLWPRRLAAIAWRARFVLMLLSLLGQNCCVSFAQLGAAGGGGIMRATSDGAIGSVGVGTGAGTINPATGPMSGSPHTHSPEAAGGGGSSGLSSSSTQAASTRASVEAIEDSLQTIHDIATENLGTLCLTKQFRPLRITLNPERYAGARQKADLAAVVLQDMGIARHGALLDALAKGLLSDQHVTSARILSINVSDGTVSNSVWWNKPLAGMGGPVKKDEDGLAVGKAPDPSYPWFADETSSSELRSPKFAPSPLNISYRGWWTYPYYSCSYKRWILSYSLAIPPMGRHGLRAFLSIDIDVSNLQVNQCESPSRFEIMSYNHHLRQYYPFVRSSRLSQDEQLNQIEAFHGSHKCHLHSMYCEYRPSMTNVATVVNPNYHHIGNGSTNSSGGPSAIINKSLRVVNGWIRGSYECKCKDGFYSLHHPKGFNGSIMEVAFQEYRDNISTYYMDVFVCVRCAPGCATCRGPQPCLASYNWAFRTTLLTFSVMCAGFTVILTLYMYQHRKVKVFKVASPIFLTITLLGCAFMYLEMAAIFPILDTYSCIATKWTRHMGFCVTYTALLMKTWRVSLTYRVKSAHKVKLTDKQLLQWMVPILLVMFIYLGTWTLSAPPAAEKIVDGSGLIFKQCSYNWWDHSLAIGEVLFLAWGIRVCYNVRNAESLYNEARLISYAIYNIALVNITMVAFHLFIFPQAGPDIKYLLGFIRTQLSTSTTIALVFGPKVLRILRGQGDQWDQRARKRGITASFSLNGIGLVPEETADLYQENEELKEEIQKLAAQIEFMRIVHMEMNNRHLKPKPGGYFTLKSPLGKAIGASGGGMHSSYRFKQPHPKEDSTKENNSGITEDGHSGTNSCYSGTANSVGQYPAGSPDPWVDDS
ncbi:probable G-protein coupled receptor CG31760 isoform X2 [Uranotaenia lowii]|uniref:probable G-protein coupled receptor CG31760 isoform X2 n=1 Tax=Uranotaenia lowii TaxID=190385 RepID=UPI002478E100|nr:probable G-protein coupled receptor CG31760 isoform X2 [Uranotaenia lowii]